jgi:uncharacterized membrane protein YtjA (UPF0391 family)
MLKWAATFFLISIVAAMLGYTNIAGSALGIAKVLFVIFLIPAVVLLIAGLFLVGGRKV